MTTALTIAQELSAIMKMPPIERALQCVKDAEACFEPRPWPTLPYALSMYGRKDLLSIAHRVMGGKRNTDGDNDYDAMNGWMQERGGIRRDNESRLRGLLWCIVELETAQENGDARATAPLTAMRDMLERRWGFAIERFADIATRNNLVDECITHMHERLFR